MYQFRCCKLSTVKGGLVALCVLLWHAEMTVKNGGRMGACYKGQFTRATFTSEAV